MTAQDEWILFLEKNPQFNELVKSGLYISIINLLRVSSLNITKIHSAFPHIENQDLDLILESLIKLKLVSRISLTKDVVYALTPLGKKMLKTYASAREGFKIE